MISYHRSATLAEALTRLSDDPTLMIVAGATDVYPAKATRAGWGDTTHSGVLDISGLGELAGISRTAGGWRIGATTTWTAIADAALPPACDGLRDAARNIGGRQIQNRGTIAGNICTASPAGDSIPCLLTLDAQIVLASLKGERRVPIAQFIDGYRHTVRAPDEIVTAIELPACGGRGVFLKLGARHSLVISIAMVAARVAVDQAGFVTECAVAVGACAPVAQRLRLLESGILGRKAGDIAVDPEHLSALAPLDDVRASADFRRTAALTLVRDALAQFAPATREVA